MIKFFFMALISGNLNGLPQVQFNSVSTLPTRNITAADLTKIQSAAGDMLRAEGVNFDNIVVHNLFFLFEGTEQEFFNGTAIPEKVGEETAAAGDTAEFVAADDNDSTDLEAVQAAVADSLAAEEAPHVVDTAAEPEAEGAEKKPFAEDDTTNR